MVVESPVVRAHASVRRIGGHTTDSDSLRAGCGDNRVDMVRAHRLPVENGRRRVRHVTVDDA